MAGAKGKSGRKGKGVTESMIRAAEMSAKGVSYNEIAKHENVSPSSVSRWFERPEVLKLRDENLSKMLKTMLGKAYMVLSKQLEDPNEWIRQGAAREIIRIAERQQEIDDRTIEVQFTAMLPPGVPQSADDDKEASEIEVLEADEISDV